MPAHIWRRTRELPPDPHPEHRDSDLLLTQRCRVTQMQYVRFSEFVIRAGRRKSVTDRKHYPFFFGVPSAWHNRWDVVLCVTLSHSSLDFCGTMSFRFQFICRQYLPIYGVFGGIMPSQFN